MMVLASIYLSVSASLPNTYGIKPVEIWLLFNLAYPFLVILVNIILQVPSRVVHCALSLLQIMPDSLHGKNLSWLKTLCIS